jgi:hypothetical protein
MARNIAYRENLPGTCSFVVHTMFPYHAPTEDWTSLFEHLERALRPVMGEDGFMDMDVCEKDGQLRLFVILHIQGAPYFAAVRTDVSRCLSSIGFNDIRPFRPGDESREIDDAEFSALIDDLGELLADDATIKDALMQRSAAASAQMATVVVPEARAKTPEEALAKVAKAMGLDFIERWLADQIARTTHSTV